jgi:hypothetical protein
MTEVGLFFRFDASWDKEDDATRFLEDGLSKVLEELPATVWATVQFGPTSFGVFDMFPAEAGQQADVGDRIAAALREQGADVLVGTPKVQSFDVLALGPSAVARP